MEQTQKYKSKLEVFKRALYGFVDLLDVDLNLFEPKITDGLKNGQVKKFEYCYELLWKLIRGFIDLKEGVTTNSPKSAMKELYNSKYVQENIYEDLIEMTNDRNLLTHIYNEITFETIYKKLHKYYDLMSGLSKVLENIE